MAEKVIFARARPREIQIREDYFYEAVLSSQPFLLPQQVPEGKIAVIVPYDGQKYFTGDARKDVQKVVEQAAKAGRSDPLSARIGYLSVRGFERTDLDEVARLGEGDHLLPLDIPIYGGVLNGVDALGDHQHVGQLELAYQPSLPHSPPISISVAVTDEDTLRVERAALAEAVSAEERPAAMINLARRIGQHEAFMRSFTLRFSVKLHASVPFSEGLPQVKRVALIWPVATSYRNLGLSLAERPEVRRSLPLHYNREANTVEWGGVEMTGSEKTEQGHAADEYRAPEMNLYVAHPDELLGAEQLQGEMTIEIPAPLSGGSVRFFNALGEEEAVTIKRRSQLKLSFTLDLLDCFTARLFSPHQQLQFRGVILDETHLSDIKALLRGEGFALVKEVDLSFGEGDGAKGYLLTFLRPEGVEQLRLWLRLEGHPARTVRQREIPDGESFTTVRESGDMIIYLRAELPGSHERPVQAMNEIHRLLKEWFEPLKTLR